MAETIIYGVTATPRVSAAREAPTVDGGISRSVRLSTTNRNALDNFLLLLESESDVSTVVTAINALL